jgi:N-acetylmuramoyl-L-alanine amidase
VAIREWKGKDAASISRGRVSVAVSNALRERMGQRIVWIPSPHFGERHDTVDTVIVHYTATESMGEAIDLLGDRGEGASAHYVLGRDGEIVQMVDLEKKAWHAGASEFEGRPDVNDFSIGIELVNWGPLEERTGIYYAWPRDYETPYPGQSPVYVGGQWWDPFTETQYHLLGELIKEIRVHYPLITPDRIVGHGDVAIPRGRKTDPGLAFDWERLRGV